jgi:hypothetical protein
MAVGCVADESPLHEMQKHNKTTTMWILPSLTDPPYITIIAPVGNTPRSGPVGVVRNQSGEAEKRTVTRVAEADAAWTMRTL